MDSKKRTISKKLNILIDFNNIKTIPKFVKHENMTIIVTPSDWKCHRLIYSISGRPIRSAADLFDQRPTYSVGMAESLEQICV